MCIGTILEHYLGHAILKDLLYKNSSPRPLSYISPFIIDCDLYILKRVNRRTSWRGIEKKENFDYFVPFIGFHHNSSSDIRHYLIDFFYIISSFRYSIYPLACSQCLKKKNKSDKKACIPHDLICPRSILPFIYPKSLIRKSVFTSENRDVSQKKKKVRNAQTACMVELLSLERTLNAAVLWSRRTFSTPLSLDALDIRSSNDIESKEQ